MRTGLARGRGGGVRGEPEAGCCLRGATSCGSSLRVGDAREADVRAGVAGAEEEGAPLLRRPQEPGVRVEGDGKWRCQDPRGHGGAGPGVVQDCAGAL